MSGVEILSEATARALLKRARSAKPTDERFGPTTFHKPLSRRGLDAAERRLGFQLPPVVRQLYGNVANGGFGPGYGLIGLVGGNLSDLNKDAVEDYLVRRGTDETDRSWYWPEAVLPVCNWGCAIHSCLDCSGLEARVRRFDPNPVDRDWSIAWRDENYTFRAWLEAWLEGIELFESGSPPYPSEKGP
jgi:hypothetical protein